MIITLSFFSDGTFLRDGLSAEAGDFAPPGVFSPLPCDLLGRGIHRLFFLKKRFKLAHININNTNTYICIFYIL